MKNKFGNVFEYKNMFVSREDHIVYTGVTINIYIDWDRGEDIEAVFNPKDGTFHFQEWIDETQVCNMSPVFKVS